MKAFNLPGNYLYVYSSENFLRQPILKAQYKYVYLINYGPFLAINILCLEKIIPTSNIDKNSCSIQGQFTRNSGKQIGTFTIRHSRVCRCIFKISNAMSVSRLYINEHRISAGRDADFRSNRFLYSIYICSICCTLLHSGAFWLVILAAVAARQHSPSLDLLMHAQI